MIRIFLVLLVTTVLVNVWEIEMLRDRLETYKILYKEADVRYRRQLIKNEMEVCNGKSN